MDIVRTRAVGIVIRERKILLMHRTKDVKEFWVFPGGGVEENETVENAVVREVKEETNIESDIVKHLYTHTYLDTRHQHFFYLCKYSSGEPKLGAFNELKTMQEENQTYDPRWVSVEELPNILLYPLEIRDWLIKDNKSNFKSTLREVTLNSSQLRQ